MKALTEQKAEAYRIFDELSKILAALPEIANSKPKLFNTYQELLDYLNKEELLQTFDHNAIIDAFEKSSKWPELMIKSFMIYSTFSGAIAAILPELITQGLIVAGFITMASLTFLVPAAIALPYFFYKVFEDISKCERMLRTKELALYTQKHIVEQAYFNKYQQALEIKIDQNTVNSDYMKERSFFNSTLLETTYLFGTMFALGIAILSTFSLSTPLGWALITTFAMTCGLMYSFFHATQKANSTRKQCELNFLGREIAKCSDKLFKREYSEKLQAENDSLKSENQELKAEIQAKDATIAKLNQKISALEAQGSHASSPHIMFNSINESILKASPVPAPAPHI